MRITERKQTRPKPQEAPAEPFDSRTPHPVLSRRLPAIRLAHLSGKNPGLTAVRRGLSDTLRRAGGWWSALKKAVHVLSRAVPRAINFYDGSARLTTRRVWGVLMREGIGGVVHRARILTLDNRFEQDPKPARTELYGEIPPSSPEFSPKVSIIVPNYNHARYLRQRLDSIYGQGYENIEVILLDDSSGDESVAILNEYAERYSAVTISRYNESNSGGVFNQWKKGLELATGELVWIAESDDYCSCNLLGELVRFFRNPGVMLAFARCDFVQGDPVERVWTTEEYLADLNLGFWDKPFIVAAHALVQDGWAIKNLVANVGSAVFRNPGRLALFDDVEWAKMRLCGDWIFYLALIRGGLVGYSPYATNHFRQHPLNTSVNAQAEDIYYREFEIVARFLARNYAIARSVLEKQRVLLYQHWCLRRGLASSHEFNALYDLDRVRTESVRRKPNLVMAVYAMIAGGGETFPILLANLLHERGYAVTILNCAQQQTEPGVRRMVSAAIPVLELGKLELIGEIFDDMGIELIHSHHAWVDVTLATLLLHRHGIRQVITMHGMYETVPSERLRQQLLPLKQKIDHLVFIAEKNLDPFPDDFIRAKKFTKIDIAAPIKPIQPVSRASLGIGEDDFVLCLVSRAIREKGWIEAIRAVSLAQAQTKRGIHLLLVGEGPERTRILSEPEAKRDNIHFLGFKSNVRDYFAAADMGFLPSFFKGESTPIVLIECLQAGRPMLASDIGEIRQMLHTADGIAGKLFELDHWEIPLERLAKIIQELADNPAAYQKLLARVPLAAAKFNPEVMVDQYEAVYSSCLHASDRVQEPKQIANS